MLKVLFHGRDHRKNLCHRNFKRITEIGWLLNSEKAISIPYMRTSDYFKTNNPNGDSN